MFSVSELLDRAKVQAGNVTDYRLAKLIGVTQSAVSLYRTGARMPDERALVKLCELSGDDALVVAAELQAQRSASVEASALWQQVAQRLRAASPAVLAAALAAPLLLTAAPDAAADPVIVMSNDGNGSVKSFNLHPVTAGYHLPG